LKILDPAPEQRPSTSARETKNPWSHDSAASLSSGRNPRSSPTGDRHGEGIALGYLGGVLRQAHRFEEAITAYRDAAAIFPGDRR
jgi:hypothetical protein